MYRNSIINRLFFIVGLSLRFSCRKMIILVIKLAPNRIYQINMIGAFTGITSMFVNINRWKAISRFAKHTDDSLPILFYLTKYFMQRGKDMVWNIAIYEKSLNLQKYFSIDNKEILEQANNEDKGVIFVSAHYGPALYTYIFNNMNIYLKSLVNYKTLERIEYIEKIRCRFLLSKQQLFLKDGQRILRAGKSEKELVRHLRRGGNVLILNDGNISKYRNKSTEFFGLPMGLSYFPFKLALKYDVTIIFCIFNRNQNTGYLLRLIPFSNFITAEEGVRQYSLFLQEQISIYPFMWRSLPNFLNRF